MKDHFSNKVLFRGAYPTKKKSVIIKQEGDFILNDSSYYHVSMGKYTLHGILIEKDLSNGIILYFHSNSSYLGDELKGKLSKISSIVNMSIATVEYPGYGVNTEVLTHDNIFETCESFLHYFQTGKYEGIPIIVYGYSLGCVFATYLASKFNCIHGMILQSPVPEISRLFSKICCSQKVVKIYKRFDCQQYMSDVKCPKLLIYGSKDQYCDKKQIQMIKSWIKEDDSELFLQGYYHNNIPYGNKKSTCVSKVPCICCYQCIPPLESVEEEYNQIIQEFISVHFLQQVHHPKTISWKIEKNHKNHKNQEDTTIATINKQNEDFSDSSIHCFSSDLNSNRYGKEDNNIETIKTSINEQSSEFLQDDKIQSTTIERNILPIEIASKD